MSRLAGAPHRTLLVIVGLVLALVAVLRAGDTEGAATVRPSSYLSSPGGARALYLVAEELGLAVERWQRPVESLVDEPDVGLCMLLSPPEGLTRGEATALSDWVSSGGNLLYAPPRSGRDQLLAALDVEVGRTRSAHPVRSVAPEGRWSDPLSGAAAATRPGSDRWLALGQASCEVLLEAVEGTADDLIERDADLADRRLVAAVAYRRGAGTILLLADAEPLVNRRLGPAGLAPLVLRSMAFLADGGRVVFDEYHHGFDEEAGLLAASWRFLSTTPLGWSLLSLLVLVVVGIVCAGVRLGAPVPPPRRPGRSSLEHVTALAAAYRAARQRGLPARRLLEGLRSGLGAPGAPACRERLVALADRVPALVEPVAVIEGAMAEEQEADLVELGRAIDQVLEHAGGGPLGTARQGATRREETIHA